MIDDITGLPLLSSDIYQIPLNTDTIPYNDLQADARLPRQPMLPDDIIPTIALTTGLRSDGTGEVVHTDDHHAQWVYVVNQPASSGGGASSLSPNKFNGPSDYAITGGSSDGRAATGPIAGTTLITHIQGYALFDAHFAGFPLTTGWTWVRFQLEDNSGNNFAVANLALIYDSTTPALSKMVDRFAYYYPAGLDPVALGLTAGDQIVLWSYVNDNPIRLSGYLAWKE